MKDVVIVSACRTAIGAFGGTLRDVPAYVLAATVIKNAVERAGISPEAVDDVRMGCCMSSPRQMTEARMGARAAGIPDTTTAANIHRVCVSGMEAIVSGMAMIQVGLADVIVAGGVEHMSGAPYTLPCARWGARLDSQQLDDGVMEGLRCGSRYVPCGKDGPHTEGPIIEMMQGKPYLMGHTAEFVAEMYGLTREEIDEVALRSHHNAERATNEGDFREEVVPVEVPQKKGRPPIVFDCDEHFRAGLTMADLAALRPTFVPDVGKVTAGNSAGINDGASAVVIMAADTAAELGATPLARIRGVGYGGCHPTVMGLSPIPAVKDLEKRTGYRLADFELLEVHEAFAAQYLACERDLKLDREICNVNGSGVALGHPVGSTGARLIVTLLHAMRRRGKTLGMATICGGGGVSMATVLETL